MRALVLVVLAACTGGVALEPPEAVVETATCRRLGPDGTGFQVEVQYNVALEEGQAFVGESSSRPARSPRIAAPSTTAARGRGPAVASTAAASATPGSPSRSRCS